MSKYPYTKTCPHCKTEYPVTCHADARKRVCSKRCVDDARRGSLLVNIDLDKFAEQYNAGVSIPDMISNFYTYDKMFRKIEKILVKECRIAIRPVIKPWGYHIKQANAKTKALKHVSYHGQHD